MGKEQSSFIQSSIHPLIRQIDTECRLCASEQTKRCSFSLIRLARILEFGNIKRGELMLWVRMFSGRKIKSKPCSPYTIPLCH